MTHAIEKELVKVSGFEPARDYKRRQDYLAALARGVDAYFASVNDKGFDDLTKEAAEWFNAAARALSNKKVIPEFDDEVASADIPMPEPDEPEEDFTQEELVEEPVVDGPALPVRKEQPPKRRRGYNTTVPPGRDLPHPEVTEEGEALDKRVAKAKTRPKDSTFGVKNTANLDKWGFAVGSKNSAAMTLFEKGCRMSDVKASLGGTYYAAIGRVIKRGHKVEHEANGLTRITFRHPPGQKPK